MLQETMQKIREAEFKADNILKQSEEDARDIVEDAGKKAVSMKHEEQCPTDREWTKPLRRRIHGMNENFRLL